MYLYSFLEQRGAGNGIDSIEERDKEATLNNPSSKILDYPKDIESLILLRIFTNTPFEYGQNGIVGFNYSALKDQIKWNGLSRKKYINSLLTAVNYFIKGINSKG